MIRLVPLSADVTVTKRPPPPPPAPEILARIERLWEDERLLRGAAVNNGRILSVLQTNCSTLHVWETEYKWWIAQRREPELFPEIRVRPLAVTAYTHLVDAIVFARRSLDVTQDAGLWEIPPSGSVDAARSSATGKVDIVGQLLNEMSVELNVSSSLVEAVQPFALMEDTVENVVDIVFDLCLAPHRAEVERLFEVRASREYTELGIWSYGELEANLKRELISPGAIAILAHCGIVAQDAVSA